MEKEYQVSVINEPCSYTNYIIINDNYYTHCILLCFQRRKHKLYRYGATRENFSFWLQAL